MSALTLEESMAKVATIASREGLLTYLRLHYAFWKPTNDNVTVEAYGRDDRNGWDTHLVCVAGKAALFADGPLPWK